MSYLSVGANVISKCEVTMRCHMDIVISCTCSWSECDVILTFVVTVFVFPDMSSRVT